MEKKLNSTFGVFLKMKGMIAPRIAFKLFIIIGISFLGCTSSTQNSIDSSENVNQLDEAGLRQGPWEIFSDSVLISRGAYLDGNEEGLWTYWYDNGQTKEEGHFVKSIKDGMWVEWYPDGEIMWKGEWKNGLRQINGVGAKVEMSFIGRGPEDVAFERESLYRLKIRIRNIPSSNLFVEVNSGEIIREGDADLFTLKTSADSAFSMAIGYMPDLAFKDFRNLVSEMDFRLK